jgi:hypothetical protein
MSERVDWRVVQTMPPPYSKCIVSGFTDGPFLDFGVRARAANPNVGINLSVLEEAAKFGLGMFSAEQYTELEQENARLKAELQEKEQEVESARAFLKAIDTLESADFRARKRPGRKPQVKEPANA